MNANTTLAVNLKVRDVSGQKVVSVSQAPPDATIGEVVDAVTAKMGLPRVDANQRPLVYHARLEREGRHLNASETVSEARLQEDDQLTLLPDIMAGAGEEV